MIIYVLILSSNVIKVFYSNFKFRHPQKWMIQIRHLVSSSFIKYKMYAL